MYIFLLYRDKNLCSVIHIAARKGCINIIKILLEHDADINAKGENDVSNGRRKMLTVNKVENWS